MTPRRIVVSTPLRLTGILIAVFLALLLISFAASYLVIRNSFDAELRDQIEQRTSLYSTMPAADFLTQLSQDIAAADPETIILDYTPTNGPRLSNVENMPPVQTLTVVAEGAISGKGVEDSYLAENFAIAGGRLTIALSRAQLVDTGEIFLTVLAICLLPTLAISAAVGLYFAKDANARITAISDMLQRFGLGDLSARVALNPAEHDDLSEIGLAVNHMAAAQEAAMAALKQATTDIAHDLKTPIQRVALTLDRLQNRTNLSPDQAAFVASALDETDRIAKTFDALLRIAQIEGGTLRERFQPVDLSALAADFVDVFEASAEESGHTLRLVAEAGAMVSGDRDLLGQVIANLIENGLRHVPAGGDIAVMVEKTRAGIALRVADNGPGIPAQECSNVLRRLYRLESSRTTAGNGLGLSMVAAISDLHGAELILSDNAPGLGVSLLFPKTT
ncbi:sensor histidine kinase [Pseudorhodobacter sp. W20_MBD10_FR17]|uniref:sensor histidine kinase n=1 Tax=Pseudorhodobacter sp. W20_MBD10_FR17 TaxID=3240266 RepID=UPI003F9B67FA